MRDIKAGTWIVDHDGVAICRAKKNLTQFGPVYKGDLEMPDGSKVKEKDMRAIRIAIGRMYIP